MMHVWEVFHYCGHKIVDGIFSSPAAAQLYRFELDNDAEKAGSRRRHEIAHLMVESDLIGIPADEQQAMCSRELPTLERGVATWASIFLNGEPVRIEAKSYNYHALCHELKVNGAGYDLFLFRDVGPVALVHKENIIHIHSGMEFGTRTKAGGSA